MTKIEKTKVCIIGAGPAGCATSIQLSNLKIPHYIIDKVNFPRDKTCGDGLILYAYKSMKLLGNGIFESFLEHPKFIHSKKIHLYVKDDLKVTFKEEKERDMIISYAKRIDFDNFLVNKLSSDYATKILGNGVRSFQQREDGILVKLKDGKQVLTQLIVGADGANSIVNRKLTNQKTDKKHSSTFVSAYFDNVENMPIKNDAEVRMVYKKMPLFFYIFPLADGSVNVSLGGRADYILKHSINLIEEVEKIINSHKKVKNKFDKAKRTSNWRGWSIPFHFGKNKVVGNRFLLVGDAGGFANAFYKEGVGTGMMSGIMAANTIKKCVNKNNFGEKTLEEYKENVRKEFSKLLKFSYYTLRVARFKNLFSKIVFLSKRRIEKKQHKMIQKRSY